MRSPPPSKFWHVVLITATLSYANVPLYVAGKPSSSPPPTTSYVAVCAALKEQPERVLEWVDYHAALGIGKFYLMATDDPHIEKLEAVLANHTASGLVELFSLPRVNPQTINLLQVKLYDACLQSVRDLHRFIGFWDIDEFLVPVDSRIQNIADFLLPYERYGALAVSWRVVGPSGHVMRPPGGVIANYQSCTKWDFADNAEVKSIVNARHAVRPTSDPHTFVYTPGMGAVDTEGRAVEGSRNPEVHTDWQDHGRAPPLALYHYVTKSEEEYREKMRRGSAMGNRKDTVYFERIAAAAQESCDEAFVTCQRLGLHQHCARGDL